MQNVIATTSPQTNVKILDVVVQLSSEKLKIGKYILENEIGLGAEALVFDALDTQTGVHVAFSCIHGAK